MINFLRKNISLTIIKHFKAITPNPILTIISTILFVTGEFKNMIKGMLESFKNYDEDRDKMIFEGVDNAILSFL